MDSALLLFLSRFNARNTETCEYAGILPDGVPICVEGIQTNDAPCHFLLRWAAASGDKITRILCITSCEDSLPAYPGGPTTEEYFRATVAKVLQDDPVLQAHYGTENIQILTIPYDYGESMETADPQFRAKNLYRCINDQLAGTAEKLYIDYTGGPRDTTFLITELARFLEYNGISCGCIAYSNLQQKQLVVLNSVYDMFRLLNAIHDFVSYGRAESLQSIYQHRNNPVVDRLLGSMTRFSQAISLCALDDIAEILTEIQEAMVEMEAYIPTAEDDVTVRMLKDFLPQIYEKFQLTQWGNLAAELGLIDWCLRNGRLQQALILFTEKVPQICFRTGILEESLIDKGFLPGQGKSPWVYGMYDNLFRQLRTKDDVGEFRQYLIQVQQTKQDMKLSYPKALRICAETEGWSPVCTEAISRFAEAVARCFSAKDGTQTEEAQTIRFYGKRMTGKNIATFIKNVLEDEQILHCLVYQDEEAWKATQKQEYRDLLKKMSALNFLKANPTTDVSAYTKVLSGQQLYALLGGYFAIKMLRNHASHASGSDAPEIRYCFEQGLIDEPCVNYSTVSNALVRMNKFLVDLVIQ